MARRFTKSNSDQITFTPGTWTSVTGPRTYAAIIRLASNVSGATYTILDPEDAGGINQLSAFRIGASDGSTSFLSIVGSVVSTSSITVTAADGWCLVFVSKTSGTAIPRFGKYVFSTNTWTYANGDVAVAYGLEVVGLVTIGNTAGTARFFDGDIAAVASVPVSLTDSQMEGFPLSLSAWRGSGPDAMWVFDQSAVTQSVVDLVGGAGQATRTGTSVSTGHVPTLSYGHPVLAATRTSPPWLNRGSGIAARNGTTSHTIPFGFTTTTGSLLVLIVYGAVTHTVSGWTQQLHPVNSGELSVFTKTGAGDTTVTVGHNAANYACTWTVLEFPTGSTYTTGTDSTGTADLFPTLTGLPGTAQTIIAARARVTTNPAEGPASTAWDAGWVEESDLLAPDDGTTDGCYMTVGRQAGYTGTSVTPTATTTYSWGTTDRQHVVFAITPAGSGGPVVHNTTGTGAGTSTTTGVAAAALNTAGTAAGVATSAGAASVTRAATATAAGTSTATGAGQLTRNTTGTVAGVSTATGAGSRTAVAAATATGITSSTGTGALTRTTTGTASGTGVASGAATVTGASAYGDATATSTSTATGTVTATGAGSGTATSTATGSAVVTGAGATGTTAGVSTAAGTPAVVKTATGTAAGVTTATGTATRSISATATTTTTGAATGSASIAGAGANGTANSVGGSTGTSTVAANTSGTANGTSAVSGTAGVTKDTTGSSTATSAAVGAATTAGANTSTVPGVSTAAGSASVVRVTLGTANGVAALAATAAVVTATTGTAGGTSTAAGVSAGVRRPGVFVAGTRRSRLAAGTRRGPTYTTGGGS